VTGACERLAAIWDVPHHTISAHAAALEELMAEIGHLADADLPPVISWAYDRVTGGSFQFWIIFALAHIEQDSRELACPDCISEVRGYAGTRWRYRVIHSATCPWWRAYRAGRTNTHVPPDRNPAVPGTWPIPHGAVVTHRGPYKRRPAQDRSPGGGR
jgi:hypothetical protein